MWFILLKKEKAISFGFIDSYISSIFEKCVHICTSIFKISILYICMNIYIYIYIYAYVDNACDYIKNVFNEIFP